MDIAAMSTMLSQAKVIQTVNIAVMKIAMNSAESSGQLVKKLAENQNTNMNKSNNPNTGGKVDIYV